MRGLQNKVIIIAGGGGGLGAATGARVSQEGAKVVIGDLDGDLANESAESIVAAGGDAVGFQLDIRDEEACRQLVAFAVSQYGGVHGLHNNAANTSNEVLGQDSQSDAVTLPLDVWKSTLDVGLTGLLHTSRAAIPAMLKSGGGSIVHMSSASPIVGESIRPAYAVAKAGLTALSRHIASRWGKEGIRSNCVAPGSIHTDQTLRITTQEQRDDMLARTRYSRLGIPEDIAALVAFLMSEDGAFINGQVISSDGGMTVR